MYGTSCLIVFKLQAIRLPESYLLSLEENKTTLANQSLLSQIAHTKIPALLSSKTWKFPSENVKHIKSEKGLENKKILGDPKNTNQQKKNKFNSTTPAHHQN